jgi:hypothetical protein
LLPCFLLLPVAAAYLAHGTFSWRQLATEANKANKAKMMKSRPSSEPAAAADAAADPDQQQAMPHNPHRIKDTVLQALRKRQAELQRRQQSSSALQSKTANPAVQSSTQAVQQELDMDLQASAAADSSSSSTVGVASVDSTRFLMPTSADETGMKAQGLALLTDQVKVTAGLPGLNGG